MTNGMVALGLLNVITSEPQFIHESIINDKRILIPSPNKEL
jgi:hypothetical protein